MWPLWFGFMTLVIGMLALDLGVFHRKAHIIGIREALIWTAIWVVLALLFNVAVFYLYDSGMAHGSTELSGKQAALQFFTGYVVEKSLSVDNIFVIAMIFAYFAVPVQYQHRVLFWGILGALVMRGVMIVLGAALIQRFDWIVYVFGVVLILTAVKMLVTRHDNIDPEKSWVVRLARRVLPITEDFHGQRFLVRIEGSLRMTPLFLALIIIENTDLLFAVDSIPAIFAVTRDPFIVFTSNVFAILGLRSLYFALAGMMSKFRYLKMSLVFLLAYVGAKMLLSHHYPIPTMVSLVIIAAILAVGVLASVVAARRDTAPLASPLSEDLVGFSRDAMRYVRRVIVLVLGGSVLALGVAMLVLPGPAFVVIPLGLAILAVEFAWPRALLTKIAKYRKRVPHK